MSSTKPAERDRQFLEAAYALEGDTDSDGMTAFYQQWAQEYDERMLSGLGYLSPTRLSNMLQQHVPPQPSQTVIDLGCGTGLTARALQSHGYSCIDGADLSEAMLLQADKSGVYRHLHTVDLNQEIPIASASYHIAVCSGTFTHGHVDASPMAEIFRILKPDGVFAFTVHKDLWHSAGFELALSSLCQEARVCKMVRQSGAYFESGTEDGWFCIYQKAQRPA